MAEAREFDGSAETSRQDTISITRILAANPDHVEFSIETAPAITWWKGLELRGSSGATIEQRQTEGADHGPHGFSVPADDLVGARLTLAKAKMFGVRTGMYEYQNLSAQRGFGYRFLWQRDDDRDGPVAGFFRDLGGGIAAGADAVAGAIVAAVRAVGEFLATVIETVGHILAAAFDAIGNFLGGIPLIGPLLRGLFHWLGTVVSAFFEFAATWVRGLLDIIGNVVAGLIRMVIGGFGGLIAWDGRVFAKGLGDLVAGVVGGVVAILGTFLAFLHSIFFSQLSERPLTQTEFELLRRVYRKSVALENVRIIEGYAGFFSLNPRPFTLGNRIYMKAVDPAVRPDILVHECCHVWHSQHEGTRYVADALAAQAAVPDPYSWEAENRRGNRRFQDFNPEAQAAFVEAVFMEGRQIPSLGRPGEFFISDPVSSQVEFRRTAESDLTAFARESILYVRNR